MGVPPNWGYLFWGPHNKDYSVLGSILGSPYFRKLPNHANQTLSEPSWSTKVLKDRGVDRSIASATHKIPGFLATWC